MMLEVTASTYFRPSSAPILVRTSSRAFGREAQLQRPVRQDLGGAMGVEWLSRFVVSADIALPVLAVTEETLSVEKSEFAIDILGTDDRRTRTSDDSVLAEQWFDTDVIVKMSPKRRFSITLRVESMGRAELNLAEFDYKESWTGEPIA